MNSISLEQTLSVPPPVKTNRWERYVPLLTSGVIGSVCFLVSDALLPNAPLIQTVGLGALAFGVACRLTAPTALQQPPEDEAPLLPPQVAPQVITQAPTPPPVPLIRKVLRKAIEAKENSMEECSSRSLHLFNLFLCGGDLFSFIYFGLLVVEAFGISTGIAIPICGLIAGVINIRVSFLALAEGIQAYKNGGFDNKMHAGRMFLDFICYFSIGLFMIMTSAALIGLVGAGVVSVASCPFLLPILFFAASIPVFIELTKGISKIARSSDMGSQLKLSLLEKLVEEEKWGEVLNVFYEEDYPLNWDGIGGDAEQMISALSKKMEKLMAGTSMGIEAGLEAFRLLELILESADKDKLLAQIRKTKKQIEIWDQSLYLRIFQQILYAIGFAISMTAFQVSPNLLNGIQNILLFGANVIPFYMDVFWHFRRNTPMIVPKVDEKELVASLGAAPQAVNA